MLYLCIDVKYRCCWVWWIDGCPNASILSYQFSNLILLCYAYSENAGLLGLTRVGSRRVVQITAGFMLFFSVLSAVFHIAIFYFLFIYYLFMNELNFISHGNQCFRFSFCPVMIIDHCPFKKGSLSFSYHFNLKSLSILRIEIWHHHCIVYSVIVLTLLQLIFNRKIRDCSCFLYHCQLWQLFTVSSLPMRVCITFLCFLWLDLNYQSILPRAKWCSVGQFAWFYNRNVNDED